MQVLEMGWIITIGAVLCAWSLLRVLGGERQRLIHGLEAQGGSAPASGTPPPSDAATSIH
jgi:hypothetical protein